MQLSCSSARACRVTLALLAVLCVLAVSARSAHAQAAPVDTAVRVIFGGFVDGYYVWDTGRPPSFDRSFAGGAPFTTQSTRHNEFTINLAHVEAVLSGGRVRLAAAVALHMAYGA